jgi:outer membrane protein OmpA-like peptidoglycan-associated protein
MKLNLMCLFIACSFVAFTGPKPSFQKEGYYVIVGAFAIEKNATRFAQSVARHGDKSECRFNEQRGIFYVFTKYSEDVSVCAYALKQTRANAEFNDAWMFHYTKTVASSVTNEDILETKVTRPREIIPVEQISEKISEAALVADLSRVTEVFLSLYNATNDRVVEGMVSAVDVENNRLIKDLKGNGYVVLPKPPSSSQRLLLICDVLGYRKVQHVLAYNAILNDSTASFVEDLGIAAMIKFDLIKYVKGDIRTLYDVFFINDADVMLPESKYELSLLVKMMEENPTCRITLHGHTNGNHFGKIISRAGEDNFFAIPKHPRLLVGTAKKLSTMRAETIREYLLAKGIEKSRINIKGWGGGRSIFDKHSANAKRNVRVDVEIIDP